MGSGGVIGPDPHPTGHAEMKQDAPPVIESHEDVFGAPSKRKNSARLHFRNEIMRERPSQAGSAQHDAGDALTQQGIAQTVHYSFDFGKLWHDGAQRYIDEGMTDRDQNTATTFLSSHSASQASDRDADTTPPENTAPENNAAFGSTADFGYRKVPRAQKKTMVRDVFESVAGKYDVMNDVMSLGIHRLWKRIFVQQLTPRPGLKLLDLAGGTGDITFGWLRAGGGPAILSDINSAMLEVGRDRAIKTGLIGQIECCVVDAEAIPLPDRSVERVTIAFGLRNCTDKDAVLREARRVLKPGGRFFCLEFSRVQVAALAPLYDAWSFKVLPRMGQAIARDAHSYQYLAESIRMFPDQDTLAGMMRDAGLERVHYRNLSAGIAAIHSGWRL